MNVTGKFFLSLFNITPDIPEWDIQFLANSFRVFDSL